MIPPPKTRAVSCDANCHPPSPSSMTPQCTDECIVVACSGEAPVCEMVCECPGNHCDLVCEDASCKDCNGFDEFLQCCTDFHSYYENPTSHPESTIPDTWSWDPHLKTFICSCGGGSTMDCLPPGAVRVDSVFGANHSFPSADPPPDHSPHSTIPTNGTNPLPCMWGNCGAAFTSLPELIEHVNVMHLSHSSISSAPAPSTAPEFLPMSCQWKDCNLYPTPNSVPGPSSGDIDSMLGLLSSHLLHDHLGINMLPAELPPPRPQSTSAQVASQSTVAAPSDDGSASHICHWSSCGQNFDSLDELTQHLNSAHVGSGKTNYDCHWQDCLRHGENGFTSKQKLCRHLQSHTGHRPFQCKICLQNFSEAATLQQHMRRHTQEKPYVCDYPDCGKSFAITGALTIHKRTHNGDKPFKCPHCDKPFSESSNLSKHLRTHTGAKPYICAEPGCNKTFARADQLTRHSRVHRKVSNS